MEAIVEWILDIQIEGELLEIVELFTLRGVSLRNRVGDGLHVANDNHDTLYWMIQAKLDLEMSKATLTLAARSDSRYLPMRRWVDAHLAR